jgi:hypothetical protein
MYETKSLLLAFDQYLAEGPLQFHAVVIGGAALNLLGVVSRLTKDCDILHPEIPNEIAEASRGFAIKVRAKGGTLQDNWLNNGPDLGDCIALAPNINELENALPWVERQDANPDWPDHVRATIADLRRRLGHGI